MTRHSETLDNTEILRAFKAVASTPDGIIVFRHLMRLMLWKSPLLGFSKHEGVVSEINTIANVNRREVWLNIRALLPWNLLNEIEMEPKPNVSKKSENEVRS